MLNNKKKKKGFTLIELIIVIAIIAVLAAIAVPKFGQIRTNANIKADIATAKNIHSAVTVKVQEESLKTLNGVSIESIMGSTITPKSSDEDFELDLVDGDVIVKIGNVKVYPNGEDDYKN